MINIQAFKKEGFSFEEIEGVKRGIKDIKEGNCYTEEEFYSRLEKRLFAKTNVNV